MAKIKFGMMMTDARGKLGGQVFSKNRSGAYVRTKVTPVNPRTSFQQNNRLLLGSLSAGWSALNEIFRNQWNSAVESWQKTNVFGDLSKPSGKNLFTGLNKVRSAMYPDLSIMQSPPEKVEFSPIQIESVVYSINQSRLTVNFSEGSVFTNQVQLRATPPLSNGTSYVKNLLRVIGSAKTVDDVTLTVAGEYAARFGHPIVGQPFYIEVSQVAENGQLSAPIVQRVIAIAG